MKNKLYIVKGNIRTAVGKSPLKAYSVLKNEQTNWLRKTKPIPINELASNWKNTHR